MHAQVLVVVSGCHYLLAALVFSTSVGVSKSLALTVGRQMTVMSKDDVSSLQALQDVDDLQADLDIDDAGDLLH